MTTEEAGQVYLTAVCPANAAQQKLKDAVNDTLGTPAPEDAPSPQIKEAAKAASDAELAGAKILTDEALVWPSSVAADITDVAKQMVQTAAWNALVATAFTWNDVPPTPEFANPQAVSNVRAGLGLGTAGSCT